MVLSSRSMDGFTRSGRPQTLHGRDSMRQGEDTDEGRHHMQGRNPERPDGSALCPLPHVSYRGHRVARSGGDSEPGIFPNLGCKLRGCQTVGAPGRSERRHYRTSGPERGQDPRKRGHFRPCGSEGNGSRGFEGISSRTPFQGTGRTGRQVREDASTRRRHRSKALWAAAPYPCYAEGTRHGPEVGSRPYRVRQERCSAHFRVSRRSRTRSSRRGGGGRGLAGESRENRHPVFF